MNFSLATSFGLMRETWPFLAFRAAVYLGIALAYVLATGAGAGAGWVVGLFGDEAFRAGATAWGGVIGFGAVAAALWFLREYTLYVVKAGHIAVLVEALEGRLVPEGRAQVDFARKAVRARFGEASALFVADQLVRGVIRAVTGLIEGIAALLPVPGLKGAMNLLRAYLRVAVGLIDEVILAHAFRTRAENPWASAREALVLYGQNARPMLVSAAWITALAYALAFAVFLLMLAPAAAVAWAMPGAWSAGGFVFALLFAWAVKAALIEPFALACLMQAFFAVTKGQTPDPGWSARLEAVSEKFRELGRRAAAAVRAPAPAGEAWRAHSSRPSPEAP
ncbi:MAG: hypothetical protein N2Z62_15730 [Rhodobacteraceae bacterium]|nr:hypothetical protein [Paracoccaceae bacterium]